jgi:hypothetical protein
VSLDTVLADDVDRTEVELHDHDGHAVGTIGLVSRLSGSNGGSRAWQSPFGLPAASKKRLAAAATTLCCFARQLMQHTMHGVGTQRCQYGSRHEHALRTVSSDAGACNLVQVLRLFHGRSDGSFLARVSQDPAWVNMHRQMSRDIALKAS